MKLNEAGQYLGGISVPTMHRLIQRGLLEPNRSLRHLLFPVAELDRFLKDGISSQMKATLPALADTLPQLATLPVILGHAKKADLVLTTEQFRDLCHLMLNGNPDNFFLIPYRDKNGQLKYAKAHKASARHRIQWAWDTVRGSASSKASIGFYPRNSYGKSRWVAMDFDAHDGDKQRPRDLAIKAFTALFQHPGPRSALLLFACSSPTLPKAAFASSANAVTSATEQFPDCVEK